MRENPLRAAFASNWKQQDLNELGISSADSALRWAYEVDEGVPTAAGVSQYIDRLQLRGDYKLILLISTSCITFVQVVCILVQSNWDM